MQKSGKIFSTRTRFSLLALVAVVVAALSCRSFLAIPRTSSEDRRKDIEYLAHWAEAYSPFVELNEELKQLPSHAQLAPRYAELAEKAADNAAFSRIAFGYASLIGESGHFYIFKGSGSNWLFESAPAYWHRVFHQSSIASPPFQVVKRGDEYVTLTACELEDGSIPKGSKILAVNGMACEAFLQHVKENTWVRLVLGRTENLDRRLLLAQEGEGFRGWEVDFLRPDQSTLRCFVPARKGPAPLKSDFIDTSKGNCICLVLEESVGYVRIKTLAPEHVGPDRETLHLFLARSNDQFSKLIIDVRTNPGGCTEYFYENLMKPFLEQPVSYKQVTGMKRRFLEDYGKEFIDGKRFTVSTFANETNVEEVPPPAGFDSQRWIFYEITRRLDPQNQYTFDGDIFVLIDGRSGSAADDFANAVKRTGMATLIGRNTYGSAAAYVGPVVVKLPGSGMEFRLEADLLINPDGSYNELVGTPPDVTMDAIDIPERVTKKALLRDAWIQKVLTDF